MYIIKEIYTDTEVWDVFLKYSTTFSYSFMKQMLDTQGIITYVFYFSVPTSHGISGKSQNFNTVCFRHGKSTDKDRLIGLKMACLESR